MQAPAVIPNCPPGLEYLTQIDQLLIKQQVELLEGMLNSVYFPFSFRPIGHHAVTLYQRTLFSLFFTAFTDFETNNKYKILNSMGQQVFFAAEGEV